MYRMKMNDVSIVVAAKQNNLKAVKELLDMNVDANSTNDYFGGVVALYYAIKHNNYEMVKWLVAAGAELKFKNHNRSGLDFSLFSYIDSNELNDILKLLLKCGAVFNDSYYGENLAA